MTLRLQKTIWGGLAALAGAPAAQAHPGHGLFEHGLAHAATSLSHLGLVGWAGFALLGFSFLTRHSKARLALRCAGVVLAAAGGMRWLMAA